MTEATLFAALMALLGFVLGGVIGSAYIILGVC